MTNLTREDRLRELELLPVWQQRDVSPVKQSPIVESAAIVDAQPLQTEVVQNKVAQEVKTTPQPEIVEPAAQETPVVEDKTPESKPEANKIAMPWVLLYSTLESQQQEGLALLRNIVKAMRLPQGEFILLGNADALQQYAPKKLVIFGSAYMHLFDASAQDLETLRGTVNAIGDAKCWVTDGVDDMLGNPSLKAQVWQDLQATLNFE